MRTLLIALVAFGAVAVVTGSAIWYFGAEQLDRRLNLVLADPTAPVPTGADEAFHRSLFIADLHADTLKWDRDLLERSTFGHLDVPRMVEGNVALQVFSIVTKSPIAKSHTGLPGGMCVSGEGLNVAALLAAIQGRPMFSLRGRALFQVRRLKDAAARSREREGPELRLIENVDDLRHLISDREAGKQVIGAILGIEGGHWIGARGGSPEVVEGDMRQLYEAGVRMFAPTHRFDNALSGSSEGCERYGLTALGRQALMTAEQLGMTVDLAHISPRGLREALEILSEPVVVSHTGVQAGCEPPCRSWRNLSDEEITLLLQNDGLIGIGFWPHAIGPSVWRIANAMKHVMDLAEGLGLEAGRNIAFGSDYDGSVSPYFDVSQLNLVTTIMRRRDEPFDERTVRNIGGLNACRFFARRLPGGGREMARAICPDPESDVPVVDLSAEEAPR